MFATPNLEKTMSGRLFPSHWHYTKEAKRKSYAHLSQPQQIHTDRQDRARSAPTAPFPDPLQG
jgi:hypothetical protein